MTKTKTFEPYPDTPPINVPVTFTGYHNARLTLPGRDVHPAVYAVAAELEATHARLSEAMLERDKAAQAVTTLENDQILQARAGTYDVAAGADAIGKAANLVTSYQRVVDGGQGALLALWADYLQTLDDVRGEWAAYLERAALRSSERSQSAAQVLSDELRHTLQVDGIRELLLARSDPGSKHPMETIVGKPSKPVEFYVGSISAELPNAVDAIKAAALTGKRPLDLDLEPDDDELDDDGDPDFDVVIDHADRTSHAGHQAA